MCTVSPVEEKSTSHICLPVELRSYLAASLTDADAINQDAVPPSFFRCCDTQLVQKGCIGIPHEVGVVGPRDLLRDPQGADVQGPDAALGPVFEEQLPVFRRQKDLIGHTLSSAVAQDRQLAGILYLHFDPNESFLIYPTSAEASFSVIPFAGFSHVSLPEVLFAKSCKILWLRPGPLAESNQAVCSPKRSR